MRTPEDVEVPDGREQCVLLCAMVLVVRCLSSFSLVEWSMILNNNLCTSTSGCVLCFNTEVCPNQLQSENGKEFWHHIYASNVSPDDENHRLVPEEHEVCKSQAQEDIL